MVDDEESIRTVISKVLQGEGHDVVTVTSGEEAIDLINKEPFPIVLADIRLEGMDGIQLLRLVKEGHPDIQVIIITSYASLESAIHAMRYGAYDYLVKPFESIDHISFAVRKAAEKYRLTAENERLTGALKGKISRLATINDMGQALHSILKTDELLNFLVKLLADGMGADRVSLMLLNKGTGELTIGASFGIDEETVRQTRINIGDGIAGRVAQEGKPILVKDIEIEQGLPKSGRDNYSTDSFISAPLVMSIPIKFKRETIGVINISDKKNGEIFTEDDLEFVTLLANQAAHAIQNARIFDELKEANRKIKDTYIGVIGIMGDLLEAKDSHTGSHCNRMLQYAMLIAERLDLSAEEKEKLQYAAMLHDIGKIGIPESILQKPGKLTDEEYRIMKKHPLIGADILGRTSFLKPIAHLIRTHHERPDGKGYPDSIKGVEIPIQSRIVSVLDAYDSMTSDRPYRQSLGLEFAINELLRYAGTQFDSEIVEIFVAILKEKG